jgi:HK97 gp10 family phage protein
MAINLKFNVEEDISKRLKELGPRVARKHGQKAVREGLKPVLAEARRQVPVDTGALKRSLRIVNLKRRFGGVVAAQVRSLAPHAHLIEFGTVKMAAQPFLRPALDSGAQRVFDVLGRQLADGLEKEAK